MGTRQTFIVPLADAYDYPAELLGNKARNLSLCIKEGFHVPAGFSISSEGYQAYTRYNNLQQRIDLELYRKPFNSMRWEEIWDVALRIRSFFSKGIMPAALEKEIMSYVSRWPSGTKFAVRSSTAAEDSAAASFAGMHESYLNITSDKLIETVKLVWASLWSDRSLLYREEKKLDSRYSAMPVLVQAMEPSTISGLAFSADPSSGQEDVIILEVISGSLDLLVDNIEEPERIKLAKDSGRIFNTAGERKATLMAKNALETLWLKILALEKIFGQPVDIEWTGIEEAFTVLQVRPITGLNSKDDDERTWYLSLTPDKNSLLALTEKVEKDLIPKLIEEVKLFGSEEAFSNDNCLFLDRLEKRGQSYNRWKKIYHDDFIPFAHGIRNFATYYNDLIKPDDPYEFIVLLKTDNLLAQERNKHLKRLGQMLYENRNLQDRVSHFLTGQDRPNSKIFLEEIKTETSEGAIFAAAFEQLLTEQMDLYYENVSLADDPSSLLQAVLALAEGSLKGDEQPKDLSVYKKLKETYLEKADHKHQNEALNWLRIGRLSWKLRDDDNILLGKLENQLYLYLKEALFRLLKAGLLKDMPEQVTLDNWPVVLESLQKQLEYSPPVPEAPVQEEKTKALKPRQLVGHPSSRGIVTGKARVIHSVADFKNVVAGEILVFDAVQPQITFIIPLAAGIVERRGGMLVHSSIIARELKIPAVNGVSRATELIETGDLLTLNGDLGLVVIGEPEFELEQAGLQLK